VFYPAVEIVGALADGDHHLVGGAWVLGGTLTLGSLVAFIQYSAAVLPADQRHVGEIQPAAVGDGRVGAHLHAARHAGGRRIARGAEAPGVARARDLRARLVRLRRRAHVLRDVSFEVRPGERVGIVGATGAGKSTLINLLLRYYDASRGRILVDGVDVATSISGSCAGGSAWSCRTCMCSRDDRRERAAGNPGIDDAQVRRALQAVHADRFVDALPEGAATAVAERGATLSTGQKQLLSFARALAFDPKISCSTRPPPASTPKRNC